MSKCHWLYIYKYFLFKVQETPRDVETMASRKNVNIEFTKETLETMLDGLGKIRDQLSSVAARQS